MKTPVQWFAMYAESHQNDLNKKIHFICVPVIYYTIIGLLLEIPTSLIENTLQLDLPLVENWAVVVAFIVLIFYFLLSFKIFVRMVIFTALCIALNQWIGNFLNNFQISIGLFVIAWIGQFYGHKIEGKKPSFLEDLQFLLIGPAWVFEKIF
jgi:uncharacterized membrane protein YGL010W